MRRSGQPDTVRRLSVEYWLSPLGLSLSDALVTLDRWAQAHGDVLDAAQRYDTAQQTRR